jgi:large subunit ribosomal protein L13
MEKIYVDAENVVLGRLGSFVAKQLMLGKEVVVFNSEKVIISGDKTVIVEKIKNLRKKGGSSQKGPKFPKMADRLLKRMIRGMLPWKKPRGREVYKNLKCFEGNNLTAEEQKLVKTVKTNIPVKYMTMAEVIKLI